MTDTSYLFQGVVHPERAYLSMRFSIWAKHWLSGADIGATVNIRNNQIGAWITTDREWDVTDLRNVVHSIIQSRVAIVGFLKGYAYTVEIVRALNPDPDADCVFGIDIPVIAERRHFNDAGRLAIAVEILATKASGDDGLLIHRCFNDLVAAMKDADDTAFHCYRAIESLRKHCAIRHNMSNADEKEQWIKFREVSGQSEATLKAIKAAADPIRHGGLAGLDDEARAKMFAMTWDVVDAYLEKVRPVMPGNRLSIPLVRQSALPTAQRHASR